MKNKLLVFLLGVVLAGCASGPMQQKSGPYETPAFSAMAKEIANDGSQDVLYKEWTTMYENGKLLTYGVFFVTEKGVYVVSWDRDNYRYRLIYKIPISYINSISEDALKKGKMERMLVITDKFGVDIGFGVEGRRAIRTILDALMIPAPQKVSQEVSPEE